MHNESGVSEPGPADRLSVRDSRWRDLGLRARWALLLASVALIGVWLGGIAFVLLVAAVTFGLTVEWVQMWRGPSQGTGVEARARLILALGLGYIAVAAASLLWLRADPRAGLANTVFVLAVVWLSDIGAYLVGRAVGGAKLAPRISPGKTVAGAVGGLIAALLAGAVVAVLLPRPTFVINAAIAAIVLGVVAQAGDLLESFAKRHFGVKDSGRLIPGHGGLLDRLDALLAVAPVAALLALAQGRGVVLWG